MSFTPINVRESSFQWPLTWALIVRRAVTTRAGTAAGGLESKTVLKICWKLSSEYITEELAEPEAASRATIDETAGVVIHVAAEARVQLSLPLVEVLPASSSLLSKGGFWRGLRQAEDWAIKLAEWKRLNVANSFLLNRLADLLCW